jgi:Na+/H+-translocating membrane pyrophosphatase
VLSAITVALGVILLGGVLLGLVWSGVRSAVTAHNHAAWAREWRRIEPQWSGRGGRV